MDRNYDDITFSHNQFCRLLETQKKLKELKVCIKMQCISVFLDITKADNFQLKNVDVSRTQGVCHVIYMFFGTSLVKVLL